MSHRNLLWRTAMYCLCFSAVLLSRSTSAAEKPTSALLEFFESKIRPVLVEKCYSCHNSTTLTEGDLAVDSRDAVLEGGASGPILIPGRPAQSRLLAILRHEVPGMKMPQGDVKLSEQVIADFEKWIADGAPDPRDTPPSEAELTQATSWDTVFGKRKQEWCWQPIRSIPAPEIPGNTWSQHAVDRFILAQLQVHELQPGAQADSRTLVRRLYFTLIGLPPSAEEVEQWTARLAEPGGYDALVAHLLDSPRFGERWARHWMDWIRYAESHGSEGDPTIEGAWHYRDYLIRALNADVPLDQLVREHIAGDLLEQPRRNAELGIDESKIGTAHWRMVFHGFAPTDALDEKARFIDDEINAFTKAFLGLTVACARCHDHKFDAISQRDYYALFGILSSSRPGRVVIDSPERLEHSRTELAALKPQIRTALAEAWLKIVPRVKPRLLGDDPLWTNAKESKFLLHPWQILRTELAANKDFASVWQTQVAGWKQRQQQRKEFATRPAHRRWNLARPDDQADWFRTGTGLAEKPSAAGEFAISPQGNDTLTGIYPAGVYSHLLSAKHAARLTSRDIPLDQEYDLWMRTVGDGAASSRYVVYDYPRNGTVFPVANLSPEWQWRRLDLSYWNGDVAHLELTTARDAPLMVGNADRSWFGVREAVLIPKGTPGPSDPLEFLEPVFELAETSPPQSLEQLADLYMSAVTNAIHAWQSGTMADSQAALLDVAVKQGVVPNQLDQMRSVQPLVTKYRLLEAEILVPTRVPGLEESVARTQHLFERGNHKQLGEEVPRRFLEAIDARPYQTNLSGRRELADSVLSNANPLTRRVLVNRIWHHLFGQGIVATPDNFGRLGLAPTHPELLDHLADRFDKDGWSLKETVRFLVTSRTWQLSSQPTAESRQRDPDNQWLSHARLRRLEAEAIRDNILAVSGELQSTPFGPPVDGNSARRSVYMRVQRNALDPFLRAFDFPEPFSATGRRDVTNVPAQSLTLLNDERVAALAANWANRLVADPRRKSDSERVQALFLTALGRTATSTEQMQIIQYLQQSRTSRLELAQQARQLRQQIAAQQQSERGILDPVQQRLLQSLKSRAQQGEQLVPQPIGRWEFEENLQDSIGSAHGTAKLGAKLSGGMLQVDHQAYVVTTPVSKTLKAKTLEAWVQLDNLDQRGGGVMTIQTPDGGIFDSIVIGEQAPRQWLAGSNFFQRTRSFEAPVETEAQQQPVHLAITYHADGTIAGYRNGLPYGKPYRSDGPQEFKAGETVLSFGLRHLPEGGNKSLSGRILRAQLYDRALSADEIRATASSVPYFVSEEQILAALSDEQRARIAEARAQVARLERELTALGPVDETVSDAAVWTDVTRAMMTFQEFLFVK